MTVVDLERVVVLERVDVLQDAPLVLAFFQTEGGILVFWGNTCLGRLLRSAFLAYLFDSFKSWLWHSPGRSARPRASGKSRGTVCGKGLFQPSGTEANMSANKLDNRVQCSCVIYFLGSFGKKYSLRRQGRPTWQNRDWGNLATLCSRAPNMLRLKTPREVKHLRLNCFLELIRTGKEQIAALVGESHPQT